MNQSNFYIRFTGAALVLGGLLVALGYLIRPVSIHQNFQIENFAGIKHATTVWIRSFQLLIFGLFLRLAGLAALGTLYRNSPARTILIPGIAICSAALLVNTLSESYYMHIGAFGAYELQPANAAAFLANIRLLSAWAICLERMGNMFFCFGAIVLGFGLWRGGLVSKWLGVAAALIGATGMGILMLYPKGIAMNTTILNAPFMTPKIWAELPAAW
jgi:hypothetical protein